MTAEPVPVNVLTSRASKNISDFDVPVDDFWGKLILATQEERQIQGSPNTFFKLQFDELHDVRCKPGMVWPAPKLVLEFRAANSAKSRWGIAQASLENFVRYDDGETLLALYGKDCHMSRTPGHKLPQSTEGPCDRCQGVGYLGAAGIACPKCKGKAVFQKWADIEAEAWEMIGVMGIASQNGTGPSIEDKLLNLIYHKTRTEFMQAVYLDDQAKSDPSLMQKVLDGTLLASWQAKNLVVLDAGTQRFEAVQ